MYILWKEPHRSHKYNQTTSVSRFYPHCHIAYNYFLHLWYWDTSKATHAKLSILNMVHCHGFRDITSMKHIINLQDFFVWAFHAQILAHILKFNLRRNYERILHVLSLSAFSFCFLCFSRSYFQGNWSVSFGSVYFSLVRVPNLKCDTSSRVQDVKWRVWVSSNIDCTG